LASLRHPVVGDTLYGAPREARTKDAAISLPRNFLHSAELQFQHPRTDALMKFSRPLPAELDAFLKIVSAR
jgi:23S rRNA pseudouridine1911/1915/1917 synthase